MKVSYEIVEVLLSFPIILIISLITTVISDSNFLYHHSSLHYYNDVIIKYADKLRYN